MRSMIEHALQYASLGWKVFPVHYPIESGCSCKRPDCENIGKHPMTAHGLNDATDDPVQILRWWQAHPEANIGVQAGSGSGIAVIDIDDLSAKRTMDLPRTVWQRTGSGGEHHFFVHPGTHVKTATSVIPGVDSRGDGGYVIVPPSRHVSGGVYEWQEDPWNGAEMADTPQWWLEALESSRHRKEQQQNTDDKIFEGGRNDYLFTFGCQLWKHAHVSPEVLKAAVAAENRTRCQPPIDDDEIDTIADSIVRYDGLSEAEWNALQSVDKEIQMIHENHHRRIAEALIAKTTKTAGPPPKFMPETGLIKELAEYILSQSERPFEELAVAASACFCGALYGRKFQTWTGLGTNLMFVGLAESGSGKEKARKIIGRISSALNLDVIGADDLASAPGLLAELKSNPSKMFMLDEFGLMLQSYVGRNVAGSKREIISTMMRLYSQYGGTYHGTAYADQKARPKIKIDNPCLVIYGTSTHKTFYDALTHDQGADGFIARLLVVDCGEKRPDRAIPDYGPMPHSLKKMIMEVPMDGGESITVHAHPLVAEAWYRLDDEMTELMTTPQSCSVYARVAENAIKLALTHCLSRGHAEPMINEKDFVWGRDIALWCANYILEKMEENVAENDTERWQNKLIRAIKDSGKVGLTTRELLRKCKGLKAWERDDILKTLSDMGYCFTVDGIVYHADQREILEK